MVGEWNPKSINETFVQRRKAARLRQQECEAKAKSRTAYQRFADEAAARTSVYDYLDGSSFLDAREALLFTRLKRATMEPLRMQSYYLVIVVQPRRSTIGELPREFCQYHP